MSYTAGSLITASSLNAIVSQVNSVFSDIYPGITTAPNTTFGYGQSPSVPAVVTGNKILASDWNAMLSSVHRCAAHQGVAITLPTSVVNIGDIVRIIPNLLSAVSAIQANRLSFNAAGMAIAVKNTTTKTASWLTTQTQTVSITFSSINALRYFFNSGGAIRFSGSLTSPGNAKSIVWQSIMSAIGTVSITSGGTASSGSGTGSSVIPNTFSATYQRIFNYTPPSYYYGSEEYRINARLQPGTGTQVILQCQIQFITSGTGTPIIGTLSSVTSERRAANANVTVPTTTVASTAIA